jgi:hypothetical protein
MIDESPRSAFDLPANTLARQLEAAHLALETLHRDRTRLVAQVAQLDQALKSAVAELEASRKERDHYLLELRERDHYLLELREWGWLTRPFRAMSRVLRRVSS